MSVGALVTLQYQDLVDGKDLGDSIFTAFGPNGLGALSIAGIPNYVELRKRLLPLGHTLAHASSEVKSKLEHEPSLWNVGWSHGKEKLGDNPDFAKGSFYANPLFDSPAPSEEVYKANPYAYPKNLWPTNDIPQLEVAFKELGHLMFDVVVLLCKQIDRLVKNRIPTYKQHLYDAIANTRKVKGRLLYYYPTDDAADDSWIGWHNDSGFLTALTSALFFNDETGQIIPNPDPNGGLWVVDRQSSSVNVKIPADHMAVQCGECLQVITGGLLVATPHSVRASASPDGTKIGRSTFPVFIDTDTDFPMAAPDGVSREQVFDQTPDSRVPPLEKRWKGNDQPFGEFLSTTFEQYYLWSKKGAM
jgi:isopenicillin N synthase-like dioxygenase